MADYTGYVYEGTTTTTTFKNEDTDAKWFNKKLPSADRWIPCTERLPDEGEEVFIYLFGESPYIAWFDGLQWKTEDFEVDEEYAPVAWMPLPEPWKGERVDG